MEKTMFNNNNALGLEIKNKILEKFINADLEVYMDREQNEYFIVTHNKELYYSEAYGMLVLEINQNILWKQGIFNFYFILDVRANELGIMAKNMSFSQEKTYPYELWSVSNTHEFAVGNDIALNDFSLAA
jgi:hypothetical protein